MLLSFGGGRPDQEAKEGEGSERLQEPKDEMTTRVGIAWKSSLLNRNPRGYGATAARLTPDQKVGSSNLPGLMYGIHQ